MALNFPSSPSVNDTFSSGGITWTYNGSSWTTNRVESSFDSLSDVNLTGAANNDLLYRSGGAWIDTAGQLTWDGSTLLATAGTISGASVVALSNTLEVQGTFPFLQLNQTDGATNQKKWVWIYDNAALEMRAVNDASDAYSQAFVMSRSGYAISSLTFGNATDNPTYTFSGTGLTTMGGALTVNGVINGPGGSAGAPTYSFASDSNTGMFGNTAGELYLVSDGTARVTVNSSGATINGSLSASSVVSTGSSMEIQGSFPYLQLNQTDGGTDEKKWVWIADGTAMELRATNDASNSQTNAFTFTRSAQNISNLTFGNATSNPTYTFAGTGALTVGGTVTSNGASHVFNASADSTGTFTLGSSSASSKEQRFRLVNSAATSGVDFILTDAGTTYGIYDRNGTPAWALQINASTKAITGNGSGLTSLNATNLSTGTVADARLSSNVPLKNTSATISGAWNYTTRPTYNSGALLYSKKANGTATNQWVRVAKIESNNGRGTSIVRLYTTGGSQIPQSMEIYWDSKWDATANELNIINNSLGYVTSVKTTKNSTTAAYLEVYVSGSAIDLYVEIQDVGHYATTVAFETSFTTYTDDIVLSDVNTKSMVRGNSTRGVAFLGDPTTGPGAVFAATGGGTDSAIQISAVQPSINFYDTDATADNRSWDFSVNSETFQGRLINDANNSVSNWVAVERTGNTVDSVTFGGRVQVPAGTVAAPSIYFGDTGTGFYRATSADTISVAINGNQRVVFDNSGISMGVGKFFGPGGSAAAPTYSFISDNNSGMYSNNSGTIHLVSDGTSRFYVDNSGAAVSGTLTLNGEVLAQNNWLTYGYGGYINANGYYNTNQYSSLRLIHFGSIANGSTNIPEGADNANVMLVMNKHTGGYCSQLYFPNSDSIWHRYQSNGSWGSWRKIQTLDSNGQHDSALTVQVDGTATLPLRVYNAQASVVANTSIHLGYPTEGYGWRITSNNNPSSTYAGNLQFTRGVGTSTYTVAGYFDNSSNLFGNASMVIGTAYRYYMDGGSSIGVGYNGTGTYSPVQTYGSKSSYGGIYDNYSAVNMMWDSSGNGGQYRSAWHYYWSVANGCMGIDGSTTSSSYSVYVTGAIYATGDIVAFSDARLKENIYTIEDSLTKVLRLRGVNFNRIDDPEKKLQMGVIAQEVLEVVPEVVTHSEKTDAEGNTGEEYGVNYGALVGVLIEAVKELNAKVDAQAKLIEELRNG
jgi:hypothetical protein